ncbi:MAG: SDR family oxidoreductase [Candidatus Omnitrophota bacterium]|nr:MAG: SDR family oxidoreductase [Candidatus Omnitrophota bacterium]
MKKLLITGSSGMLGSSLVYEIGEKYNIYGIYRNHRNPDLKNQFKADITDRKKLEDIIGAVRPDFLIHTAALTNVDTCEKNFELARATNSLATRDLASILKSLGTRFIYISTESVFDGKKGNYDETDAPCPINNYAKTKHEGEIFVEQLCDNFVIIRTTIFGWNRVKEPGSFAEWVYKSLRDKQTIKMFTDVIFSPITVNTLSLLIDRLLQADFTGTLNIGSRDSVSKCKFGIFLAELFGFDKSSITPISVDGFKFAAKRPKNVSLNVSRAEGILGPLPTVEDELGVFHEKRRL